eukprot:359472-Chlamydomonas_euryale.AAC.12
MYPVLNNKSSDNFPAYPADFFLTGRRVGRATLAHSRGRARLVLRLHTGPAASSHTPPTPPQPRPTQHLLDGGACGTQSLPPPVPDDPSPASRQAAPAAKGALAAPLSPHALVHAGSYAWFHGGSGCAARRPLPCLPCRALSRSSARLHARRRP